MYSSRSRLGKQHWCCEPFCLLGLLQWDLLLRCVFVAHFLQSFQRAVKFLLGYKRFGALFTASKKALAICGCGLITIIFQIAATIIHNHLLTESQGAISEQPVPDYCYI